MTVEAWARSYIETTDLEHKCAPPAAPDEWEEAPSPTDPRPGRPADLKVTFAKPRNFKLGALERMEVRAALHHKFWHHELQAAELMCWALLKFPDAPLEFKKGLLRIFRDEVRHMKLYQDYIEGLGYRLSDFEVRDWFWERVPTCTTPLSFVALLGMGLEGANLEHTDRFGGWFKTLGDERAAKIQEQVGLEEIGHVRFAIHWFNEWTGDVSFERWCRELPPPLSPLLMRGKTFHWERRRKAHYPEEFLKELERWKPEEGTSNK